MLASAQRTSRIVFVTLALLMGVLAAVIVSGPADAAGSKARAHTATCAKVKAHGKAKQRAARARARACAARLRRIAAAKRRKTPPPPTTTTTTTPPPTATSATPPPTTTTTTPPPTTTTTPPPTTTTPPPTTTTTPPPTTTTPPPPTTTTPPPTTTTPPPTTTTPPPSPSPAPALRIGLNANSQGWGTNAATQQNKVAPSGVKWLREEFGWSTVEPSRGTWDWSVPDAVVTAGAQRGITILPLLMNTPSWAGPAKTDIPSNPTDYADYVAHVVARYGPGGSFWSSHTSLPNLAPQYFEIWNEPYYPQFSNNHIDPARYANLFKAAVIAGRAANSQAKFLIASDTDIKDYTGTWVSWPDAMLNAVPDLGNYIDAIAVHPYSKHYSPDTPLGTYAPDKFLRLTQVHDRFAARGVDRPLWITEVGWSTCTGDTTYCVSESQQASYTATMFQMLHTSALSYVKAVFLYHLEDLGTDQSNSEMFYGALHQDGTPKPVWNTLKTAVAAG